jgi:hypothetical protein
MEFVEIQIILHANMINFKKLSAVIVFLVLASIFFVSSSYAAINIEGATTSNPPVYQGPNLTIQSVFNIFNSLVCYFVQFVLVFMVLALIWTGVSYLRSQGVAGAVTEANKSLQWTVIGIAVILGSYTIVASIAYFVGSSIPLIPLNCSNLTSSLSDSDADQPYEESVDSGSNSSGSSSNGSSSRNGSTSATSGAIGEQCTRHDQCSSGYCGGSSVSGRCASTPNRSIGSGGTCLFNEWCSSGLLCVVPNGQKYGACTAVR